MEEDTIKDDDAIFRNGMDFGDNVSWFPTVTCLSDNGIAPGYRSWRICMPEGRLEAFSRKYMRMAITRSAMI